jgi:NTP pyrophosphatase (non-canonical NTP hydrolase)
MTYDERFASLEDSIVAWAQDRNILKEENAEFQMLKVAEEMGEVAGALAKQNTEDLKDGIGDVFVTLIVLSKQVGYSLHSQMTSSCSIEELEGFYVKSTGKARAENLNKFLFDCFASYGKLTECFGYEAAIDASSIALGAVDLGHAVLRFAVTKGLNPVECLEVAYNEIKDRTGRTVDGVFVKDE